MTTISQKETPIQPGGHTKSFTDTTDNNDENLSSLEHLSSHLNQSHSDISYAKNRAKAIYKKIEVALSNCTTLDAVRAGETHLKNALKILESIDRANTMKLDTRKRIAPNSNNQQQPRFCSTRQKRACTVSLSKPNDEEIVECRDILQQIEIQVCGKCLQTNDEEHGDTIAWIQCSYCSMWFHCLCIDVDPNDNFCCEFCVKLHC